MQFIELYVIQMCLFDWDLSNSFQIIIQTKFLTKSSKCTNLFKIFNLEFYINNTFFFTKINK